MVSTPTAWHIQAGALVNLLNRTPTKTPGEKNISPKGPVGIHKLIGPNSSQPSEKKNTTNAPMTEDLRSQLLTARA